MHRVGSPAAHVAAAKAIPRCPPRQPVRAHPKPGHTDSFTVATDNDDFNTPRSNLRHVHADVVLVQEAKNEHVRKLEPKRYGVHQNTHRKDQAGTAVAVLDFLLGHEDMLLRFCEDASVEPRQVHLARHRLGGEA